MDLSASTSLVCVIEFVDAFGGVIKTIYIIYFLWRFLLGLPFFGGGGVKLLNFTNN